MALLGGAAAAWPLGVRAQSRNRMRRIGIVMAYAANDPNGQTQVLALRDELQKFGWIEGGNIQIDVRYAKDNPTGIRDLARELLAQGPDLMVSNSNLVTSILQNIGRRCAFGVHIGFRSRRLRLHQGVARPGGSVTRFANFQPSMGSKWLEKLHEIAPQLGRVGLMYHPEPPNIGYLKSAQSVAPQLNVKLVELSVHNSAEIEGAFSAFREQAHSGLIVVPNVVAFANSELIVGLAERHHLPAIYPFAFFAREGGLISYGFDESDQFRQGAVYIDKILKDAKPADLPVQHPTKFEITINLRTAKALDINVPTQLLQLADQVIE